MNSDRHSSAGGVAPADWICEVLSPKTHRLDRVEKRAAYAREAVQYLWLVDPLERTLETYELIAGRTAPPDCINGVSIDYLPIDVAGAFLEQAFERPLWVEGCPIAPPEVVVCTTLLRLNMRDQADIVEMVKAGLIDCVTVRAYLAEHTPMLVSRWDALVAQANAEIERSR